MLLVLLADLLHMMSLSLSNVPGLDAWRIVRHALEQWSLSTYSNNDPLRHMSHYGVTVAVSSVSN